MILVICAVAAELRGFAGAGVDVVAVGVGPVEAAIGTARALVARPYTLVINAGIGGGFRGRAAVGDAVAVGTERYVEIGREDGAAVSLPGGLELATSVRADAHLLERCLRGSPPAALIAGSGVTSATITTSDARAAALAAAYAPAAESMEGFAVLRAAQLTGVPALEVRGISNIVGNRETSGWNFRAGAAAAVRALEILLGVVEANA